MTLWRPGKTRDHCGTTKPHGRKGAGNRSALLGLATGMSRVSSHVHLKYLGLGFPSKGKELYFSLEHPWPKWDSPLKIPYVQGLLSHKSCHFQLVWLPLSSRGLAVTCLQTLGLYGEEPFLLHRHPWPKLLFFLQNSL